MYTLIMVSRLSYKAEYCQQDVCEYGVRLNDYIKINMLPEFDVDESVSALDKTEAKFKHYSLNCQAHRTREIQWLFKLT